MDRNLFTWLIVCSLLRSLSARRAWIEITSDADWVRVYVSSLSARRAWIEIAPALLPAAKTYVALRKESVDRNKDTCLSSRLMYVALRKESVDRNAD